MDISGINNNINNNTINTSKNKAADNSFEKALKNAVDKNDEKELKKVCREFEGIMLNMMFKEMKATIHKSELLPEDSAKDIFDSMLDDKLIEEASKERGMGLADVLFKQLSSRLKSASKADDGENSGVANEKADKK